MTIDIAPILGHQVLMEDKCPNCASRVTAISEGRGPHAAALKCAACGRFNRWLSGQAATALVDITSAVTKVFGKPTVKFKDIQQHIASLSGADDAVDFNSAQGTVDVTNSNLTASDLDEMYGSPYFNGVDFPKSKTLELTISKIEKREFKQQDGTTERKAVLSFNGAQKTMVLNATNYRAMTENFGRDPSKWVGTKVTLYGETTSMGRGVRIRSAEPEPEEEPPL